MGVTAALLVVLGLVASPCQPPERAVVARVKQTLVAAYQPPTAGYQLVATPPGCAPAPTDRIVIERGSGHGAYLEITEARLGDAGWELTQIAVSGWGPDTDPPTVKVRRGRAETLAAALAEARLAAGFVLSERAPRARSDSGLMLGGWSSSGDFHVRVDDREFTGYASSGDQLRYLPLRRASELVAEAIAAAHLPEVPLDDDARALFSRALVHGTRYFDEDFHWWVRELYVRAAAVAGTPALLPTLRTIADRAPSDPSGTRTKEYVERSIRFLAPRR